MSVNKYVGDYRLLEEIDERGHITTTTEYIGDDYFYELAAQPRKKDAAIVAVAVLAEWACWVAAMIPFSSSMQRVYVSMPFVFSAIPLFLLTGVVWHIVRREEPLEHRHADKIRNRYPAACVIGGMLAVAALVGAVIGLAFEGFSTVVTGDFVFLACDVMLVLMSMLAFAKKGSFALRSQKRLD